MTTAKIGPLSEHDVVAFEHTREDEPIDNPLAAWFESAAEVPVADTSGRIGRHRASGRRRKPSNRKVAHDRMARLRLLGGSLIGAACLVLAFRLQPGGGSPFRPPSEMVGWIALIAGIAGIWLVPGMWMSAVMMRTGASPAANMATRIGTTLSWYALVGPVVHMSAEGALVTTGGLVGVTVAATAAVCLGVALGLVRRPANPALRFFIAALVGGGCAHAAIWLSMRFYVESVNYQHISRLHWFIVLGCALLTAIGAHSRPHLPLIRTSRHIRTVVILSMVVAATALALLVAASTLSPAQRVPTVIGAEQIAAPPGADVAFDVTGLGPGGADLIQDAIFSVSDGAGRPVPVQTFLDHDGTAASATLSLMLDPASRPQLCAATEDGSDDGSEQNATDAGSEPDLPVKLTLRDENSGLLVQAVLPADWCAP